MLNCCAAQAANLYQFQRRLVNIKMYVGWLSLYRPVTMNDYRTLSTMINFSQTRFLKSAPTLALSPKDCGIEVAFVGRSNAGKSSAINVIVGQQKLARTSKTPGRTQLMNFFEVDEDRRLVDLPGYGYAQVPERVQSQIQVMLQSYLTNRHCLQGLILLMDIRQALTHRDHTLLQIAQERALPVHILLTKCDKLKRGASNNILLQIRKNLTGYVDVSAQTFSALKHLGLEEVQQKLTDWFTF